MADGRIQPSRIAQVVEQVSKELEEQALHTGQAAAAQAGVQGLDRAALELLGQLKFRASASQNVLEHLIECANLARLMGAELGLPDKQRQQFVRAAFLHDIGKAAFDHKGLSHALAGADFLRAQGEDQVVVNAVAAHHKEVADESLIAPLLRIVDAISGARPGARREDLQATLKRMADMEKIALEFKGVAQAYVYQAGRELHVAVKSEEVSDSQTAVLAHQIAVALEQHLRSGAPVRVSVVREVRAQGLANWEASSPSLKP
jgi:ribonuclease Y